MCVCVCVCACCYKRCAEANKEINMSTSNSRYAPAQLEKGTKGRYEVSTNKKKMINLQPCLEVSDVLGIPNHSCCPDGIREKKYVCICSPFNTIRLKLNTPIRGERLK